MFNNDIQGFIIKSTGRTTASHFIQNRPDPACLMIEIGFKLFFTKILPAIPIMIAVFEILVANGLSPAFFWLLPL